MVALDARTVLALGVLPARRRGVDYPRSPNIFIDDKQCSSQHQSSPSAITKQEILLRAGTIPDNASTSILPDFTSPEAKLCSKVDSHLRCQSCPSFLPRTIHNSQMREDSSVLYTSPSTGGAPTAGLPGTRAQTPSFPQRPPEFRQCQKYPDS